MDVTTLVAGPAQAGPQPPVCKPGIGLAAGAGTAPAADAAAGDGFASLVAAALDQHDGDSSTSCHDTRGDGVEEDPAAEAGGDDASPRRRRRRGDAVAPDRAHDAGRGAGVDAAARCRGAGQLRIRRPSKAMSPVLL